LLHDAEFLASLAAQLDPAYTYPAETFDQAWRLVCLNQFHDIIPGSSIILVYAESQWQYEQVARMVAEARNAALEAIAAQLGADLLLVNPTSFPRSDPAFLPGEFSGGFALAAQPLLLQPVEGGVLVAAGELPPYSVTPLTRSAILPRPQETPPAPLALENACLLVCFNAAGDITRIWDKTNQREVLPPGALANQFQAFEDRPKAWDAWDIDIYYDDKVYFAEPASSIQLVEAGPLRWTMEIKRKILHSEFTQRISLRHRSARLDFETRIDWRERHILLKTAFPVDILAPAATYEIQWGNVQRPTHRNTSWDWARFETCAQKWADLSEGGYGVSLLNDCKYGHDIQGNVLRLSLLRSPTLPDPEADQGLHHFTYSLLPHAGGWEASTSAEAYALNDPMISYQSPVIRERMSVKNLPSFVQVDSPNIIIETVKQAEDGSGLIVRLYESQRRRGEITLTTAFRLAKVQQANLLEEAQAELSPQGNQVTLFVKPYEIVTLRLVPAIESANI
jgi:alpha-mannosidase